MKKYEVKLYYHTNLTLNVEAESEQDAREKARAEAERECYTQELLEGLQEEGNDVECIEPQIIEVDDKRLTDKQKRELGYD